MKLPLPRSRRARLLVGVVVLAGAGGVGAVTVLGGGENAPAAHAAEVPPHPQFVLTVDEALLPEAPVPADAPVVHPEGAGGMLSTAQLAALDGASVVRDVEGQLRVVHGDWRAGATTADRVAGLPGVVSVEPAAHGFLVETDLSGEQLTELPGVVAVAHEDGTPVAAPTDDPAGAERPDAEATGH